MNDQVLLQMIAIAEEASISKAAARLYVSQPTLSRTLQKVETELGETLFYRTSKGLFLTPSGQRFIAMARRICKLYSDMNNEFCDVNRLHKGQLTVSGPTRLCSIVLPESLKYFKAIYPNVDINIRDIPGNRAEEEVLATKADLGFIYLPARFDGFVSVPLFDIISNVVVPKDHPANSLSYYSKEIGSYCIDVKDLGDYEFILPAQNTNSRRFADRIFKAAGIEPKISMEAVNLDIIIGLVSVGLGITIIPRLTGLMYEKFYNEVNIYHLDKRYDSLNNIAVIYNSENSLTVTSRAYLNILKELDWDRICPKYTSTAKQGG